MKKFIQLAILACLMTFMSNLPSFANINSSDDIQAAIDQLQEIANCDFLSFINRGEIIGNNLATFKLLTAQYKTSAKSAITSLEKLIQAEEKLNNSDEISDTEKENKIGTLYQEADKIMAEIPKSSVSYIQSLNYTLPTLTYERYKNQFINYINGIGVGIEM